MIIPCYHSVHPTWDVDLSVPPAAFDAQCRLLARRSVLGLDDIAARGRTITSRRRRDVLITFDDGFADNAEHAAPILARHGLRATFFVVAGSLAESGVPVDWVRGVDPEQAPPLLDADAVASLAADGHEVANHSWSHRDLTQLSESECTRDLKESRELLSDLLHTRVRALAYPFGRHAEHVRRAAERSGHDYAFALPDGPEEAGRFSIPRVGIYRSNGTGTFLIKTNPGFLDVRTSRRLRRFRDATARWR